MSSVQYYQSIIEETFSNIQNPDFSLSSITVEQRHAVKWCLDQLDSGALRVAEPSAQNKWVVNDWLKKAILLSFRFHGNELMADGLTQYFDKVPLKFSSFTQEQFESSKIRVVPQAVVRHGAYVGENVVLMPSYTNIGAYIGPNTMVDTWATVGSCAQIGANVHLSGGVGIGGVLEPLQANPTIIEDNCFIGARSEVVEGVIIGEGSVLSMGVYISQSTRIYNRDTKTISYGYVPPGSVVVPGNLPSEDGTYGLYAAIIVKQVDAKTRAKVSINELLRSAND